MVASIKQISSGSNAGKYFYFTESNFESSKSWHISKATKELGLKKLDQKSFENVLNGKLGPNIQLGRKTKDGIDHRAGYELILSAPKSVSIMGLVAGDKRLLEAHEKAVGNVLGYVERNMIYTRVQENGKLRVEKSDNAVIAKYTHVASRLHKDTDQESSTAKKASSKEIPDPQLHTHNVIANATLCRDGKWRSIMSDDLYKYKMHIGEVYRTELAHNIKKLGYSIEEIRDDKGRYYFEIKGVPKDDIAKFSSRRQGIEEEAEKRGIKDQEGLAYLAKITREDKRHFDSDKALKYWQDKVVSLANLEALTQESKLKMSAHAISVDTALIDRSIQYGIDKLSERESTWDGAALVKEIVNDVGDKCSISDIEKRIDNWLGDKSLLKSQNTDCFGYTTNKNLKKEKDVIKAMRGMQNVTSVVLSKEKIDSYLRNTNLTEGQKDAVSVILNSKDRVVGVQGLAGTAKTTAVNVIRDLAATKNYELLGLAPTKSAVKVLEDTASVKAQTLHSFVEKYKGVIAGRGTKEGRSKMRADLHNKIVIVDEASLIGTNLMRQYLTLAEKLGFRGVLIGDSKQIGAIAEGKPFYYLQEHGMNTAIMSNIKRQVDDNIRKGVYLASDAVDKNRADAGKNIRDAFASIGKENIVDASSLKQYKGQGKIEDKAIARLVYNQWSKQRVEGKDPLIICPSNGLRKEINILVRSDHIKSESVEQTILVNKKSSETDIRLCKAFEKGDVLLFNRGYKGYGIQKGEYCKVSDIDKKNLTLEKVGTSHGKDASSSPIVFDKQIFYKSKGDIVNVYKDDKLKLAVGDKIRWVKNSSENKFVINGHGGVISNITKDKVSVDIGGGKIETLPRDHPDLKHIDYNYSSTIYGAQGKSAYSVIGVLRSNEGVVNLTTQRSLYVTLSRAKSQITVITDNYMNLLYKLSEATGGKTSALEHQTKIQDEHKEKITLEKTQRYSYINVAQLSNKEVKMHKENPNAQNITSDSVSNSRDISSNYNYNEFINSPERIMDVARSIFGEANTSLSSKHQVRFGNTGKISVNLKTGQWYDFSSGDGGSLYKYYRNDLKNNNITSIKYRDNIALTYNPSLNETRKQKSLEGVKKLVNDSYALGHKKSDLGRNYFRDERNIDISKIAMSNDIKYNDRIWSSEDKAYHPGIVSVARDRQGEVAATQSIYLNKDAKKTQDLEIKKRTSGILKGSWVEITTNTKAKDIFIAEGLETALSIAQNSPNARVICTLGIHNMQNIDFSGEKKLSGKNIILCADNDGKESNTSLMIDRAYQNFMAQGFKSVSMIRPENEGKDFNDLLKDKGNAGQQEIKHLITLATERNQDNAKNIISLHGESKTLSKKDYASIEDVIKKTYQVTDGIETKWNALVEKHGIEKAAAQVKNDPSILGQLRGYRVLAYKNEERKQALAAVKNCIKQLSDISHNKVSIQQNNTKITKNLVNIDSVISNVISSDTKHQNIEDMQYVLYRRVQQAAKYIGNVKDYGQIKDLVSRYAGRIIDYRNRFNEEPKHELKKDMFLKAYHESSRKEAIATALQKTQKINTPGDKLAISQKTERLLAIDSRKNISEKTPFVRGDDIKTLESEYINNNVKIHNLAKEYLNQNMSYAKAHFMATETVKYQEKHGVNMPPVQQESLSKVGDYVSKHYNLLVKQGLDKKEAAVVYNEGSRILQNYKKDDRAVSIAEREIKNTQKESKAQLESDNTKTMPSTINTTQQQKDTNAKTADRDIGISL